MTFDQAMDAARQGRKVTRAAWYSTMTYVQETTNGRVLIDAGVRGAAQTAPWVPTAVDLVAQDWELIDEPLDPMFLRSKPK